MMLEANSLTEFFFYIYQKCCTFMQVINNAKVFCRVVFFCYLILSLFLDSKRNLLSLAYPCNLIFFRQCCCDSDSAAYAPK